MMIQPLHLLKFHLLLQPLLKLHLLIEALHPQHCLLRALLHCSQALAPALLEVS